MNLKSKIFIAFIGLLLFVTQSNLFAEEARLTVALSSNSVAVGDRVQVEFSLNGSGKNFQAPTFSDFNVLMGPNQSMSTQIFNGSISQTNTYTYILQPIKEGVFKIGSASIEVNGKQISSNPFVITVSKGSSQSSPGQQGQQNKSGTGEELSKNVFLRAFVDKSSVYRGEGIVCTYRLYTRVALVNYGLNKLPSYNGFWSQEIDLPQQLEFRPENLDGVSYKVADIKKMVLFPQRSGSLQIEPMEGEVIARVQVKRNRSNDPFDQFFNDPFFNNPFFGSAVQDVKVPLKSKSLNITVKELPTPPAGYTGAVGKFSFEIVTDKKEVKAHNPVSIKIKITGKGNLKLVEAPEITFPPDFETYDPKETNTINASSQGVSGSKTFEYLVIPRNEGEYKIDIKPFSYFSLETKKFQSIPAPTILIKVLKGDGTSGASSTVMSYNKEDVLMLGKDIRYIKTNIPQLFIPGSTIYPSTLFYFLATAPSLLFIGLLFVRKKQLADKSNITLLKSRKAAKAAKKRLAVAKKHMTSNDQSKFLDEMSKALWGFLSDKLQIPVSHLSRDSVKEALSTHTINESSIQNFTEVIDACEFARFAPAGTAKSMEEIYQNGIQVITQFEEQIKS